MKEYKINIKNKEYIIIQDVDGQFIIPDELRKDFSCSHTALKPAHEPIVVARKPITEKNIALNVLKWGTGGININGCRIEAGNEITKRISKGGNKNKSNAMNELKECTYIGNQEGRFPANFIISSDMAETLDNQSGISKSKRGEVNNKGSIWNSGDEQTAIRGHNDQCGASRFFLNVEEDELDDIVPFYYCAKAGKKERNAGCEDLGLKTKVFNGQSVSSSEDVKDVEKRFTTQAYNNHPTVKPIKLMSYLVRLVTPADGTCLDPFAGSGSTLLACKKEGFNYVGIELMPEYVEIIEKRLETI